MLDRQIECLALSTAGLLLRVLGRPTAAFLGTNPSTSRIVCMFGFCAHLSRFTGPGRVLLVLTVVLTTCWKEDCFLKRGKSRWQNSLSVKQMSKLCHRLATSGSFTQEVSAGPGHLRVRAASARRCQSEATCRAVFQGP